MVPVAEEPPFTPLTCQVTALLEALVTVAVNCVVLPRRVWPAPATLTVETFVLELGGVEVIWLVVLVTPTEHPVRKSTRQAASGAKLVCLRARVCVFGRGDSSRPGMEFSVISGLMDGHTDAPAHSDTSASDDSIA